MTACRGLSVTIAETTTRQPQDNPLREPWRHHADRRNEYFTMTDFERNQTNTAAKLPDDLYKRDPLVGFWDADEHERCLGGRDFRYGELTED